MQTSVHTIDKSVHQTNEWLRNLSADLQLENPEHAFEALRAVLHCLRDRIPPEEAVHFAAQLPLVVKGLFYEEWDPSRTPEKTRHVADFLDRVRHELVNDALKDRAQEITEVTLGLISDEIDPHSVEKFRQHLPKELQALWPDSRKLH